MRLVRLAAVWVALGTAAAGLQVHPSEPTPAQRMAATVLREWPAGVVTTIKTPGQWSYEEAVLLDGLIAEWHATADGADFAYVKSAVDKYVTAEGTTKGYKAEGHTLDDIALGRAVIVVYRVTQEDKYARAAKFLHDQLALQPRAASGGYWHKGIYPNQMWLDGAYMAEPFRAMYAATFGVSEDWDDIAKQLLLMDKHMRDPRTGLMRHGWDESRQMPWADKNTGLSPEVWARAMGWYTMALVDVLDWFPREHPQRKALEADLTRTMAAVLRVQDPASGLWRQVMTKPRSQENFAEASASCMFVYALSKGVRLGYLPQADVAAANKGWEGIRQHFVTENAQGLVLHGTVKVGGLGGTPYRAGDFAYYVGEKVGDQDAKGVGAFLLAGSEREQAATGALGQGKTALMDGWFNSQTRSDAFGGKHVFHYKWGTDSNEGDSFFGYALGRYGVRLAELDTAPTAAALKGFQFYLIVSPDNTAKNPAPHFVDKASGDAIEAWVKAGGVLLLFSNDRDTTEFVNFNTLSARFGMHFNPVLSHHVVEPDHRPGEVVIPPGTEIFGEGFKAYWKDTSTISVGRPAIAIVTDRGDVMVAVAHFGKGAVLGVVDPWFYNEYADGRKMGEYQGFRAAQDIARWAVRQTLH